MVDSLMRRTAPTVMPGDANLSRLASLPTNGGKPPSPFVRKKNFVQNVAGGGSAFGNGNLRFTAGPGGRVGTTAAHVLVHPEIAIPAAIPTRINVNGSETRTSIKEFFPDPKAVKIYNVIDSNGRPLDIVKLGRPADILAHFEKLATAQPTASAMKTALAASQARWQIGTASRPQSYAPEASAIEPLTQQSNWSETTPKFSFELTALPLQVKDLSDDLEASGLGSFAGKPNSWLALGAIGGDEANRSSPYKDLYLVNRGVSGSESKASGVSAADNGTLIEGVDVRDAELGWTPDNVQTLVDKSALLRSALKAKFPKLTTSQAAEKLYRQGFVKIAFITKDLAIGNLKTIGRTAR